MGPLLLTTQNDSLETRNSEVALITNRSLASIALIVIVFLADTNTLPHLAPAALPAALLCNELPDATTTAATTTAAAAAAATRRARHGAARRYGARDGDCVGSLWREVRRSCL